MMLAKRAMYGTVLLALAAPLLLFVAMENVSGWNPVWAEPTLHFWIVSGCTVLSACIGTALALSVQSVRTTRTVFLALGFVAVAMIFATHGLSTPGFIVPGTQYPYAVVISAGLSELVGALFIFLSVLPATTPGARWVRDHGAHLMVVAFALLLAYVGTMMFKPDWWGFVPTTHPWDTIFASATMLMLGYSALRYLSAWRLTHLPGQFAMVCALVLLAESQVSMYYGVVWAASWWLYHVLMLAAFVTLIVGWVVEAARAKSLVVFSRAIELRDELNRATVATPEALARLEAAIASKDEYTRHHMTRVAAYAVAIAREMRLDEATTRMTEVTGLLHDIGKIRVPDAVLMKPGPLTDDEYAVMKEHAAWGEHITRQSKVLSHVSRAVGAHHEKFSGNGYPNKLVKNDIPIEARIVAVADTYDALTTNRVYRPKRSVAEAVVEMRRVSGTQLDPQCVEAFIAWLEKTGRFERGADSLAA